VCLCIVGVVKILHVHGAGAKVSVISKRLGSRTRIVRSE
jgi:hypothetical protein